MKTKFNSSQRGFSLVEIILAIVLFAGVSVAIWRLSSTSQRFNTEATSMAQQNVYSTLRAEIAVQGLNPTTVTNFMAPALTDSGGTPTNTYTSGTNPRDRGFVLGVGTSFETTAMKSATGANRTQPGSATRTAINYQTPSLSAQTAKGTGFGYSIGSTGVPIPATTTPLTAPTFNFNGDLTSAPFPLNGIISYPTNLDGSPKNPPGTIYRYTTDGSTPTNASPVWNNNPGWTVSSFPYKITIEAFNSDPQYSPSSPASATYTYTYTLSLNVARADGRGNLTGFYYSDLQNPTGTGIVLSATVGGASIIYTLDGSTPSSTNGTVYGGPFAPAPSLFNPNVTLNILVTYLTGTPDPRYIFVSTGVHSYALNPVTVPLPDPAILTDNSQVYSPGTPVDFGSLISNGTPDTSFNNSDQGDNLSLFLQ